MNSKRLILAWIVGFVAFFLMEFLVHGLWLKSTYDATASLWRTESDMQQRFGWMVLGQALFVGMFTLLWAKGFAATLNCARCAVLYGLCMGLFNQSFTLITYVVSPLPASLAAKWFVAGIIQAVLLGLVVYAVYKPKPVTAAP
jgi:hypothetical protein